MHAEGLFSLLYTLLTGNEALSAVITGVFEDPPSAQKGTYLVLGDYQQTGGRLLNDSERTGFLTIHIWSSYKGRKQVLQVAGLVDEALENNGFLFEDLDVFHDDESGWKHGVITYKVYYRGGWSNPSNPLGGADMRLTRASVSVVTDASGDAVVYTPMLNGVIRSVRYIKPASGGLDVGADIDIVTDKGGVTVWDKDDLAASAVIYPMVPAQDNAGADVAGSYAPIPVCDERIKITVANGGAAGAGVFEFVVEGVAL